jgi:germacradienol/geosmin synthase
MKYEGELHNMVLVVRNFLGIDTEQAVLVVNDLMTKRMEQFEHVVATELPFVAEQFELDEDQRAALDEWVVMIADWMSGILVWHRMTARYPESSLRDLPTVGAVLHGGGPSGPGTSAAQLARRVREARARVTAG